MDKIITTQKDDAVTLRWLQLAVDTSKGKHDKYARPVLSGIYVENGKAVTADGFRIHIAPRPEALADAENKTVIRVRDGKTLHKTPGRVYNAEIVEGHFPDYEQVDPSRGQQPVFTIAVSAEYLREALEMPNNAPGDKVVLTFYGPNSPFTVSTDDNQCKAVVMPMTLGK